MERNDTALTGVRMMIADGIVTQEAAEKYFPELKKSEDEKIRNALIRFHKSTIDVDGIKGENIIAWLEKQGETFTKKDVDDAYVEGMALAKHELEKQGEQKTVEWHREDEQNLNTCLSYIPDEYLRRWLVDVVHVKYDKPADKVEPKFKVGDEIKTAKEESLIITKITEEGYWSGDLFICGFDEECLWDKVEPKFHKEDFVVNKDGRIFQIMCVDNDFNHITYACRFIEQDTKDWVSYSEDDISLWDISNAKAGDVLASNLSIFIFSQEYMAGKPEAHCGIMNGFFIVKPKGCWTNEKIYPANKEQRYFLFTKMREAGYEWDADRKELRKIKPKFHKGEWVTNGIEKVQITGYDIDYGYQVDYKGNLQHRDTDVIEKEYHLWTIRDAKDGDVVVDKSDGTIGIFQSIGHHPDGGSFNDPSYCFLHCRYDDGYFYADFENGNTIGSDDLIPASKEQRETLLKAMADAGWDFDFEKKELKKIEPIDEYEGLTDFERAVADACIGFIGKEIGWKQYVKDNADNILKIAVKKFNAVQPQPEWSEEDKVMLKVFDSIIRYIVEIIDKDVFERFGTNREELFSWIKSIKDRYTWKPSEEQIKVLEFFIPYVTKCSVVLQKSKDTLLSLLSDLKKLREE